MKAIICTAFGSPDVLQLQEVATPVPADHEVLVRVRATLVNFGDTLARRFSQVSPRDFSMPALLWLPTRLTFGLRTPRVRILGSEFAGEVAAVGKAVTRFRVGDAVFGYRGARMGANAEYVIMPEDGLLARKPANMTYPEAAALPYGTLSALSLLRKVDIQPGQRVLINGASGGVGSYAVQFAKLAGAHVTGVCGTPRLGFVKSLGADVVIDYTTTDFTRSGATYDLIVDVQGKCAFERCKAALTPNGRVLYVSFKMKQVRQMLRTARGSGRKVICALSSETRADLETVCAMAEDGRLRTVIDRCFPLEQTADAHRYIEGGHKQGHIAITVA